MTIASSTYRDLASPPSDAAALAAANPSDRFGFRPELFASTNPVETLQTVANLAREAFHCDGAGVVVIGDGGLTATSASGVDAVRADALQVEHHEGPALAAIADRQPIPSADLRSDSRWRFWGPTAADLGFRSVLSLPLIDADAFGALTLYSRHPSFFFLAAPLDAERGFARQASIAIAVALEREQLVRARDSRGIVGQAQGILMHRYEISADQAFGVLRRYSSLLNQKLRVIAEQVIRDRGLPDISPRGLPSLRADRQQERRRS